MGIRAQPASFADLLRCYRRRAGLTQEELAERAHLSVRGISNLERGVRRLPQRGTVTLLAEALALSAADRAPFEAAARGVERQPRGEGLPARLVGAPGIGPSQDAEEQPAEQGWHVARSNTRVTPRERADRRDSVGGEADGQPTTAVPTNLPLALTSFVGREQEMATVRRLLGETRSAHAHRHRWLRQDTTGARGGPWYWPMTRPRRLPTLMASGWSSWQH